MHKALRVIGIGVLVSQAMFWLPKLAKASSIQDGGAVIVVSALCNIDAPAAEFDKTVAAAMIETGIYDKETIGAMMYVEARRIGKLVLENENIKPWCVRMRSFYIERGMLK